MEKKLPTVDIKGKEYVMVKDRILAFNEQYPNGYIQTDLISAPSDTNIVIRAVVVPDADKKERMFIDYAQETVGKGMINTTSALENASTSAVGRALAFMGIGIIDSIASADEVHKATNSRPSVGTSINNNLISEKQVAYLFRWAKEQGAENKDAATELISLRSGKDDFTQLTVAEASELIGELIEEAKQWPYL